MNSPSMRRYVYQPRSGVRRYNYYIYSWVEASKSFGSMENLNTTTELEDMNNEDDKINFVTKMKMDISPKRRSLQYISPENPDTVLASVRCRPKKKTEVVNV